MHDWWLAILAAAFGKIGFVETPTILYRQHGSNQVGFGGQVLNIQERTGKLVQPAVHDLQISMHQKRRVRAPAGDLEGADIVITILMATYNGESYLAEQIESILRQSEWLPVDQDAQRDARNRFEGA